MTNRLTMWLFPGIAGLAITALAGASPALNLQSDTGERLTELETVVAEQDDDIGDLRRDLRRLDRRVETVEARTAGDGPSGTGTEQRVPDQAPGEAGDVSFSGTGASATDPFELAAGSYRLEATCGGGFIFSLDIQRIDGDELLISTLIGMPPYSGSEVLTVAGGRYVFSVTCEGSWTVSATRLV